METLKQLFKETREQAIQIAQLDVMLLELESECGYTDLQIPEGEVTANA